MFCVFVYIVNLIFEILLYWGPNIIKYNIFEVDSKMRDIRCAISTSILTLWFHVG
jgi:hypothetical protein